jgi:hypothetical protein
VVRTVRNNGLDQKKTEGAIRMGADVILVMMGDAHAEGNHEYGDREKGYGYVLAHGARISA